MKKYTPKFFKDNLPEWKRKKDALITRYLYRPLSFVTASVCSNLGITANGISYFSILIAISACILIALPNHICNIIGAILVNIWLLSDCTDGNIARSVRKQPFGEFADGISSYILVGFLCTSLGIAAYFNSGLLIQKNCVWMVVLGAIASSSDTLMRLIYQKYRSNERELADKKIIRIEDDKRTNKEQTTSLLVRFELEFGVGGILPLIILIGAILKAYDLVVMYCFMYYFFASIVMSLKYIRKAMKKAKEIEGDK